MSTIIFSISEIRTLKHKSDLSRNQVLGLEPQRSPKPKLLTIILYFLPRLSCTTSAEWLLQKADYKEFKKWKNDKIRKIEALVILIHLKVQLKKEEQKEGSTWKQSLLLQFSRSQVRWTHGEHWLDIKINKKVKQLRSKTI